LKKHEPDRSPTTRQHHYPKEVREKWKKRKGGKLGRFSEKVSENRKNPTRNHQGQEKRAASITKKGNCHADDGTTKKEGRTAGLRSKRSRAKMTQHSIREKKKQFSVGKEASMVAIGKRIGCIFKKGSGGQAPCVAGDKRQKKGEGRIKPCASAGAGVVLARNVAIKGSKKVVHSHPTGVCGVRRRRTTRKHASAHDTRDGKKEGQHKRKRRRM